MPTFGSEPFGTGFFGRGDWGRRIMWGNVPTLHKAQDEDGYLESLLKTWSDELTVLKDRITALPLQREPYAARGREGEDEWFYFIEREYVTDDTYGSILKLKGERDSSEFPYTPLVSPPDWTPYIQLNKIGPWWKTTWQGITYEVALVQTRNFSDTLAESVGNEVWVKNVALGLFPFSQFGIGVGTGDATATPTVTIPDAPFRLEYNASAPWLTANSRVTVTYTSVLSGTSRTLYDVPTLPYDGTGTLYIEDGGSPGEIDTGTSYGTINYETAEVVLNLGGVDTVTASTAITATWYVRGYYLQFFPPSILNFLAKDFGFSNDLNDPEFVQRSTIANITKYLGLKASQDSYRIRGEISGFNVVAHALNLVCSDDIWDQLPADHAFEYEDQADIPHKYTDLDIRTLRFDIFRADLMMYNDELATPVFLSLLDRNLMFADSSADGTSFALTYALNVLQGYKLRPMEMGTHTGANGAAALTDSTKSWSPDGLMGDYVCDMDDFETRLKPGSAGYITKNTSDTITATLAGGLNNYWNTGDHYVTYNLNGKIWPASVVSYEELTDTDLVYYGINDGYRVVVSMEQYQFDFFNFKKGVFGFTELTGATPPALEDPVFWIDAEDESVNPHGWDSGALEWTVIVGMDTSNPAPSGYVALRYWPGVEYDCCICRSHRMRITIEITDESEEYYGTGIAMTNAIKRLIQKIKDLLIPIHVEIVEWAIVATTTLEDVKVDATVSSLFSLGEFLDMTSVYMDVEARGDLESGGETISPKLYDEDNVLVWNPGPLQTGFNDMVWRKLPGADNVDVTAFIGDNDPVKVEGVATGSVSVGELRWTFRITRNA